MKRILLPIRDTRRDTGKRSVKYKSGIQTLHQAHKITEKTRKNW